MTEQRWRGVLSDRQTLWAFWLGVAMVTAGVLLHLPMLWMARDMGFRLAGMPMDASMIWGMALIVVGVGAAAVGLMPKAGRPPAAGPADLMFAPAEEAAFSRAHAALMAALVVALAIDVMKPAALGFVVPGMQAEYGLGRAVVAWLPLSALAGTVVGSLVWGLLADVYGRKATILLSSVMFVGTSICGTMPSFAWNLFMCFLMGAAAGGMLPVAYALLAETMPTRHRGWSLVLVGGLGAVGGYLAASLLSAWLQPLFGWRVMWLLNLPTGLLLIAMSGLLPESPKFLVHMGRIEQAFATLSRFGVVAGRRLVAAQPVDRLANPDSGARSRVLVALTACAASWGLVNFGLLLWLPSELVARGLDVATASRLIGASALIALPTVFAVAFLYSRWSTKGVLITGMAVTAAGLTCLLAIDTPLGRVVGPVPPVALLVVGVNAVIAVILPYTAECYPMIVRGRATGWVAAFSKAGGLIAQALTVLAVTPTLEAADGMILAPVCISLLLLARTGVETRGRDLRDLEFEGAA